MSWVVAILLAAACFAVIAFGFRLPKNGWVVLLAALALGLAGYALQATPGMPGAPKSAPPKASNETGWALVDLQKQLVGEDNLSQDPQMVTADALMRQGQFDNAAVLLRGIVHDNPKDAEAWLSLANALTFHAEGNMTPAALFAYRRAADAQPDGAGPAFFLGLDRIGKGEIIQGHRIWRARLDSMPEDGPGREILEKRLGQLEELLRRVAEEGAESGR